MICYNFQLLFFKSFENNECRRNIMETQLLAEGILQLIDCIRKRGLVNLRDRSVKNYNFFIQGVGFHPCLFLWIFFQVHPNKKQRNHRFSPWFPSACITRNIRLINYNSLFYKNQIILNLFTINLRLKKPLKNNSFMIP